MPTRLKKGCSLTRIIPSKHHDCRKSGEMVVTLDNELGLAILRLRPLGVKQEVSLPIDTIYSFIVKQEAELARQSKRKGA